LGKTHRGYLTQEYRKYILVLLLLLESNREDVEEEVVSVCQFNAFSAVRRGGLRKTGELRGSAARYAEKKVLGGEISQQRRRC